MVVESFSIKLDDPDAIRSPGSIVTGSVLLSVSGDETTSAIRIRLAGAAVVTKLDYTVATLDFLEGFISFAEIVLVYNSHNYWIIPWPHHIPHHHIYHTSIYRSSKELVDSTLLLFGDDENIVPIPNGNHTFPFTFQLPVKPLPPTVTLNWGCYIEYGLEASIAKPWYKRDIRTDTTKITVITPHDLNLTPWARAETSVKEEKRFGWWWWWDNEPLVLSATINPSGYCLGKVLPVIVEIDNGSDRRLADVTVELIQVWTLTAWGWPFWSATWKESIVISEIRREEGVPVASKENWHVPLKVPSELLPTLNDFACEIVKMGYMLRVTACVESKLASNLHVDIPVIIGNIPFNRTG